MVPSYALSDTDDVHLATRIAQKRATDGASDDQTGLFLLQDGVDAFVARMALARAAERSLDVQYYLYHDDLSGGLLTAELARAAERGVRVRILLDDMDTAGKETSLALLEAHPNIEIRLFNPFIRGKFRAGQFITRFGSITRRAHNKAMIADNQLAIVGGRNIGDEYFGASLNLEFGDLDVAITTPAASEVSTQFDLYWNNSLAYPVALLEADAMQKADPSTISQRLEAFYARHTDSIYIQRMRDSDIYQLLREGALQYYWGDVEVLYDHPDKISSSRDQTEFHMAPQLVPYLTSASQELLVISPYFVPGKKGVELFRSLQQQGVQVKVFTNSLMSNDVAIVHAGYSKYRKKLLKAGVEIYELDKTVLDERAAPTKKSKTTREGLKGSKASLHAKYFIIDRGTAFIGSLNLDPRSVVENTEIGVIIDAPDMAEWLAQNTEKVVSTVAFHVMLKDGDLVWQRQKADGSLEVWEHEPHSSWWDRVSIGFMKWLPAESQL